MYKDVLHDNEIIKNRRGNKLIKAKVLCIIQIKLVLIHTILLKIKILTVNPRTTSKKITQKIQ